ncbi:MAG: helix-turn-helix domain-containing protein [Alkalibacterium sp.]
MHDEFFKKFIISLFSDRTNVTTRQLALIAGGKRTPSVLFNIEKNKLYLLFGLFPEIPLKDWEHLVKRLLEKQLLSVIDDKLSLTTKGKELKQSFSEEFPIDNSLEQLRYATTKPLFWNRLIFTTQVFSEYSYQNKKYVPYLSSLEEQRSFKKWLKEQERPMNELAKDWLRELTALLHKLPPNEANFFAGHFTGFKVSGSTSRQLQERYELSSTHYTVLVDQLSYKAAQLDENDFPLLTSLWYSTYLDSDEGLSRSARRSKLLIEKGNGIETIARRRRLKSNTIKEHILECVLILDWPYFKRFISPEQYAACHAVFEKKPDMDFSAAKELIENLDFFTFRLIEIERTRHYE